MKYVRVENGRVAEIFGYDPFKWIADKDFLLNCRKLNDNVKVGYGWTEQPNGKFSPPEQAETVSFAAPQIMTLAETMPDDETALAEAEGRIYTVRIDVHNQILNIQTANSKTNPQIIADSRQYLYIKFTFSDDWAEPKYALFYAKGSVKPVGVRLADNGCYVPYEVIKSPEFGVAAYCINDEGILITTDMKPIYVGVSGYTDPSDLPKPVPAGLIPVYSPVSANVTQIRVVDGILEYTNDGAVWHSAGSPGAVGAIISDSEPAGGLWFDTSEGNVVLG